MQHLDVVNALGFEGAHALSSALSSVPRLATLNMDCTMWCCSVCCVEDVLYAQMCWDTEESLIEHMHC